MRFLLAMFVDLNGKPCAMLVPVTAADELEAGELGFASSAAGLIGQRPQDPDLVAVPDPDSYVPVPFIRPGLGIVYCEDGRHPAGISTQDPELSARLDPVAGGRRIANYLRVLTLEAQTIATPAASPTCTASSRKTWSP